MVKTIKGTMDFERLKAVITEFIRKLPSYDMVQSNTFEVDLRRDDRIAMTVKEPTEEKCETCEGSGKIWDDRTCYACGGTGKETTILTAWVEKDEKKPVLKIRVFTNGKDMSIWKPDVERVQKFIEGLVGEPCITIPMTKKQQLASQPPIEEALQATLDKLKNQV